MGILGATYNHTAHRTTRAQGCKHLSFFSRLRGRRRVIWIGRIYEGVVGEAGLRAEGIIHKEPMTQWTMPSL